MWERPKEGDLRILTNLKTKAEQKHTENLLNHIFGQVQLPDQIQGCWISPQKSVQLLPSLDKVGLTKEKHATARNMQNQMLSKAYEQWEI